MAMSTNDLENRVITLARQYAENYTSAELEKLLVETWAQVEGSTVPIRSTDSPGKAILKRLHKNLQRYSEVSSATVGMIAMDVMQFLHASGYNVERFEIPVAVLVAILVQSVLGEYEKDNPTNNPPTNGGATT